MSGLGDAVAGLIGIVLVMIMFPALGAFFGAFTGWAVGLFWDDNIKMATKAMFGWEGIEIWQMGLALGFIGGFFKTSLSQKSED